MHSACALVPVFNHERAVGQVIADLRSAGLPVVLVDDGSGPACAAELDRLAGEDSAVSLVRLGKNQGKGGAVMAGLHAAEAAGFTHALQVDADGQHDSNEVGRFLSASQAEPDKVICGEPVFDASMPGSRRYGRYLTHALVWLNTLSFSIRDSMCGFRIYPLRQVLPLLANETPGRRMDFDIEILVRLNWQDVGMRWLPVRVSYPTDGVSHFHLLNDNWLISWMHLRLFFGMLRRSPRLIGRQLRSRLNHGQVPT
jgi:glycosyltransferase involved in cell wall biosynthesis